MGGVGGGGRAARSPAPHRFPVSALPPAPCLPGLGLQKAVLPPSQAPFPATPFGIPPEHSLQDTLARWESGGGERKLSVLQVRKWRPHALEESHSEGETAPRPRPCKDPVKGAGVHTLMDTAEEGARHPEKDLPGPAILYEAPQPPLTLRPQLPPHQPRTPTLHCKPGHNTERLALCFRSASCIRISTLGSW